MLSGFVSMSGDFNAIYEFRNARFERDGMYAEFKYEDSTWSIGDGFFPFYDGVKTWFVSEIRFVLPPQSS